MASIPLPPRLIALGEEPRGERVNVYQKIKTLCGIFNALDDDERQYLSRSPFARLLEFPNNPAWSASFGIFILGRQLEVTKPNEIWVLFAGTPIRFSLREFKIVTGLPCGRYPSLKMKKKKGTAGKTIPFYTIVDGFLVPTSHHPKIIKSHAEMVEDVDAFLAYPWGRYTFEMMIKSIKEREIEQLAIAPAIQDGLVIDNPIDSESEGAEDDVEVATRESVPFKNDMFDGACFPSQIQLASKKQKRGPKSNATRNRKAAKTSKNHETNLRRLGVLRLFLWTLFPVCWMRSLKLIRKTIISAVTDWFTKNTIIEGDHSKDSDSGVNHPKETAPAGNVGASNTSDLGSNATNDEFGFNSLRTYSRSHCPERTSNIEPEEVIPMDEDIRSLGDGVHDSQVIYFRKIRLSVANHHSILIPGDNNVASDAIPPPQAVSEDNTEVSNGDTVKDDLSPRRDVNVEADVNEVRLLIKYWFLFFSPPDLWPNISSVTGAVTSPKLSGDNEEVSCYPYYQNHYTFIVVQCSQQTTTNVDTLANEVERPENTPANLAVSSPNHLVDNEEGVPMVGVDYVSNETSAELPDIVNLFPNQLLFLLLAGVPLLLFHLPARIQMRYFVVVALLILCKLDGRFQYDKKTKLLVGHPSPVINQVNVDPEERFQNSLKKLKAISSISICGGIALSNKDILDLIDRKKNLTSKVMDALIRFSRHLLRTDDVDGEKLRLELFTEAHYIYQPFNFDKKHWVALAVALKCRKIIVLDSNIQRRKDSAIHDELMPLAVMLPYVTTASRVHKEADRLSDRIGQTDRRTDRIGQTDWTGQTDHRTDRVGQADRQTERVRQTDRRVGWIGKSVRGSTRISASEHTQGSPMDAILPVKGESTKNGHGETDRRSVRPKGDSTDNQQESPRPLGVKRISFGSYGWIDKLRALPTTMDRMAKWLVNHGRS
uniref:Uncharacterized protein At2g06860 n=1 Tax=Arabidopsis thaliana TaxID=3702 RepID=Q9ZVE3_ARATH|nr:hypothetical protein [Arabidopsis thaliana]